MPRITLIHATRVAIDPIEEAAARLWPEAETLSLLEEGLSADRQRSETLAPGLHARIAALVQYAERMSSDGVLFTCSAFGRAIEDAAGQSSIPVLKPNEAMFDAALGYGDRIAMIYTFPPAATGMEEEFREAATACGRTTRLILHFSEGALDAKQAGDDAEHDRRVAETARQIRDADAIMLAQFSMASAAGAVREQTALPVLTSPDTAMAELRRRVEANLRRQAC